MKHFSNTILQKLCYIYQLGHGLTAQMGHLESVITKDGLKRIRTALTNLDKALADTIGSLDQDAFRQFKFYHDTHETLMLPKKEKLKYMKRLEETKHLYDIRTLLIEKKCNKCIMPTNKVCNLHNILKACGTPYFWDMDHLDTLDEEGRKLAEHCGYCGGIKDERTIKKFRTDKAKRRKPFRVLHPESARRTERTRRRVANSRRTSQRKTC